MLLKAHLLPGALSGVDVPTALLIEGEEDELRARALAAVTAWVLGDTADATFNCDVLYADEHDAATILGCAQELSVFAPYRLVIVKRAEKISAKDGDRWLAYLKEPNTTTTLVFVASKLDKRLKVAQAMQKSPVVVDCGPLMGAALNAWILDEARVVGVSLSDDAVAVLRESAAHSLSLVRRELEKLALSTPEGTTASGRDVETARGVEPGASVFDLTTAIGGRDARQALTILARNLEAGEAPLRVLGALTWQYRRLWKMMEAARQGGREGEVARTLRIDPSKVRNWARRFTDGHFRQAFGLFLETDSKLKGAAAGSGKRVLESVLLQLCRQ
ncbi:MAG: DNA polymerase III subunit delta [Nitrospiraceae bacterium]